MKNKEIGIESKITEQMIKELMDAKGTEYENK